MLAIMEFIFISFWVWLGTMMLISALAWALHGVFLGIRDVPDHDCSCSKQSRNQK